MRARYSRAELRFKLTHPTFDEIVCGLQGTDMCFDADDDGISSCWMRTQSSFNLLSRPTFANYLMLGDSGTKFSYLPV